MAIKAQLICFSCEVRPQCKAYRENTGSEYGIWGGEHTKRGQK